MPAVGLTGYIITKYVNYALDHDQTVVVAEMKSLIVNLSIAVLRSLILLRHLEPAYQSVCHKTSYCSPTCSILAVVIGIVTAQERHICR